MISTPFVQDLLFLDKSFADSSSFFDFVFPLLFQTGYVRSSFLMAIKQREKQYPTALPTEPYAIALPHTDIEHIVKPFISVTRLTQAIPWHEMASDESILDVKFIFLLGFINKDGHIELLQKLLNSLCDTAFLQQLHQAGSPAAMQTLLTTGITT